MGWTAAAAIGEGLAAIGAGAATAAGAIGITGAAAEIVGDVAMGAVVGAVVGGVKSAVTGGNIMQGIESGGLIGGVTAGIGGGVSAASAAIGGTAGATGSATLTAEGLDSSTASTLQNTIDAPVNLGSVTDTGISNPATTTIGGSDFTSASTDAANSGNSGLIANLNSPIGTDTTSPMATSGGAVNSPNSGGSSSAGGINLGQSMGSAAVQGAFGLVTGLAKGVAAADATQTQNKWNAAQKVVTPTGVAPAQANIQGKNYVDTAQLDATAANPELMGSVYKNLNTAPTTSPTGTIASPGAAS